MDPVERLSQELEKRKYATISQRELADMLRVLGLTLIDNQSAAVRDHLSRHADLSRNFIQPPGLRTPI